MSFNPETRLVRAARALLLGREGQTQVIVQTHGMRVTVEATDTKITGRRYDKAVLDELDYPDHTPAQRAAIRHAVQEWWKQWDKSAQAAFAPIAVPPPAKPMVDPLKRTVGGPQAPCLSGDVDWQCQQCHCWKARR